jgi:apolipoprotein N-acyltransferase
VDWIDSVKCPVITGSLHWERNCVGNGKVTEYSVYNTAFLIDRNGKTFEKYFKILLLPFSEAMPFETFFPLLNRINLGEADFSRGVEEKIFLINSSVRAAPFICFEMVFPDFVRRRVAAGANLLVNITNDGWFGKTNGPYHHASMVRLRSVENGVSIIRCANSGISMAVDQYGRTIGKTSLSTRVLLTCECSLAVIPTFYNRHGDWPLIAALLFVAGAMVLAMVRRVFYGREGKI